jgi:hypothetical protein
LIAVAFVIVSAGGYAASRDIASINARTRSSVSRRIAVSTECLFAKY